jgi:hypothetical protein
MEKPKTKRKSPPKKSGSVSPEIASMLAKLAAWKPKCDADVLEVANRLAQATREAMDKTNEAEGTLDTLERCKRLEGSILTSFNGINVDFDIVIGVSTEPKAGNVTFDLFTVFRMNRVGPWSTSRRVVTYNKNEIVFNMLGETVAFGARRRKIDDPAIFTAKPSITEIVAGMNSSIAEVKPIIAKYFAKRGPRPAANRNPRKQDGKAHKNPNQ